MFAGRHYHPVWTMIASATLMAVAALMLFTGFPIVALAIVLYGAGNGIGTVARGARAARLVRAGALSGAHGAPRAAVLVAMAVSPYLGGLAFQKGGADWTLGHARRARAHKRGAA